jgi:hypothetical protein
MRGNAVLKESRTPPALVPRREEAEERGYA